jgi:ferredoxin
VSLITTQDQSFRLVLHETLLDGLERTGHEVEYQCRSGYCGMCRVKMLRGEVRYLEQPLAFVATDEILPCCCVPADDLTLDCQLRPEFRLQDVQQDLFPVQQVLFPNEINGLVRNKKTGTGTSRRKSTSKAAKQRDMNLALF